MTLPCFSSKQFSVEDQSIAKDYVYNVLRINSLRPLLCTKNSDKFIIRLPRETSKKIAAKRLRHTSIRLIQLLYFEKILEKCYRDDERIR